MWLPRARCGGDGGCLAERGRSRDLQVRSAPNPTRWSGRFRSPSVPARQPAVGVSLFTGQGTGFVKPTVSCCVDATTGAQVTPAGLTMSFRLPMLGGRAGRGRGYSPGIYLSPGATEVVTLTVAADTSAAPGQYAVKISASHPAMGTSEQTIFVNVLGPTPADDTVTPCSSQVNNVVVGNGTPPVAQVLPVMGATDSVFGVKAANQGKTSFQVGAQTTDSRNGWTDYARAPGSDSAVSAEDQRGDHRVVERFAWRQGSVDRERCRVRDRVVAATHPRDSGAERADYDLEVRGDLARAEARRLRAVVHHLLVDVLSTGRRLLAARVLVVRRRTRGDSPLVPQHLTGLGSDRTSSLSPAVALLLDIRSRKDHFPLTCSSRSARPAPFRNGSAVSTSCGARPIS